MRLPKGLVARWSRSRRDGFNSKFGWGDFLISDDKNVRNAHVLNHMLEVPWTATDKKQPWTVVDELDARGYDITTLRISIQRKTDPTEEQQR